MTKGKLGQLLIAEPLPYNTATQEGDEWTCEGSPGWLPLPECDFGKTPGELFAKYREDGCRGLRVRRFTKIES